MMELQPYHHYIPISIANKLSIVVVQTRKYDSIYFFRQQYAKKQGNLHFVYKLHLYFSILFSK